MSSPFYTLLVDHLRCITGFLPATEIARLWLTGNRRLHRLLASGGVSSFVHDIVCPFSEQLAWPSIISYIPIDHLCIRLGSRRLSGSIHLEVLPSSLKSLTLDFSNWFSVLSPYLDVDQKPPSTKPRLKYLFPSLETLKVANSGGVKHFPLNSLPPSLTHIELWHASLTPELLSSLPLLQDISKCSFDLHTNWADFRLPNSLKKLGLNPCPLSLQLDQLGSFPSLTYLCLQLITSTSDSGIQAVILPSTLSSLEIDLPNSDNSKLLASLPRSLTSLILTQPRYWIGEEVIEARLPQGLKYLSLSTSHRLSELRFISASVTLTEFISALPRSLTEVWCRMSSPTSLLSTANLNALPRSLTVLQEFISQDADLSVLPESLRELRIPNTLAWDLKMAHKLPRNLTRLDTHLATSKEVMDYIFAIPTLKKISSIGSLSMQTSQEAQETQFKIKIASRFSLLSYHLRHPQNVELFFEDNTSAWDAQTLSNAPKEDLRVPSSALEFFSVHGPAFGQSPILSIQGFAPSSLSTIRITNAILDPSIVSSFRHCPNLLSLGLNDFHIMITNDIAVHLPRRLYNLELLGSPTDLIDSCFFALLPRSIRHLTLPVCSTLEKEYESISSSAEAMLKLPPLLYILTFKEGLEKRPSMWTNLVTVRRRH